MNINKSIFLPMIMILVATFIISTSGVFARMMLLFPPFVIWVRCGIAVISLLPIYMSSGGKISKLPLNNKSVLWTGVLMTLHWVLFFYSLEYSSVAVAAVSIFTYPMMTIILETILVRRAFDYVNFLLGFIFIVGIFLLSMAKFGGEHLWIGVILGIFSALAYALRNLISEPLIKTYSSLELYLSQLIVVVLLLSFFSTSVTWSEVKANIWPLLGLGVLTTAVGHWMLLQSLKYFSAGQTGLMASAQPIFAIFLAFLMLGEVPETKVLIGGMLILSSVIVSYVRGYYKLKSDLSAAE